MKQLTLIRHAKAEHTHSYSDDKERCLHSRGHRDAHNIAELFSRSIKPQEWFVSPAIRAQQTARYFTESMNVNQKHIHTQEVLYSFDLNRVLTFIEAIDDQWTSAALVFHNPTVSEIACYFCYNFQHQMPTCAVVTLQFNVSSWGELSENSGSVVYFDYPERHVWSQKK